MEENLFGAVAPKPPGNFVLVEVGEGGFDWVDPIKMTPVKTADIEPATV